MAKNSNATRAAGLVYRAPAVQPSLEIVMTALTTAAVSRRSLLLSAIALGASSCYGKFALTGKLHGWIGGFGNKFLSTLIFWLFVLLPVYEVTLLVDAWILNLIEFWTGSNPLAVNENADGSTTRLARLDEKTVRVHRQLAGQTLEHFDIVLTENGAEVRSLAGTTLVAAAVRPSGELALQLDGRTEVIGVDQIRAVEASSNKAIAALNVMPGASIASR